MLLFWYGSLPKLGPSNAVTVFDDYLLQAVKAAAYYAALIVLVRMAGKRMAGQTTTFDLLVLITLGVVIQTAALEDGAANAVVFVLHRGMAAVCARSPRIRHLLRGHPRPLVRDGRLIEHALTAEGVTRSELLAGLRKLGYERIEDVRLAVLEETGHISAVGQDAAKPHS